MEELTKTLGVLSIGKEAAYSLSKTGILYDTKLLEDEAEPASVHNLKQAYKKINENFTNDFVAVKGRSVIDDEKQYLDDKFQLNKSESYALGCCFEMVDQLCDNKIDNGVVFTNSSIEPALINACINKHNLKRILVVNWNINHNLKLQNEFYDNAKVLCVSIHRFDHGKFEKVSLESNFDHVGDLNARGSNVNLPLNDVGFGDFEYILAFFNLLLPIAYEFNPELVIIPTNFDSAIGSLSGKMRLTPSGYAHLLQMLSCVADGKILMLINGKNDSQVFGDCVQMSVRSLLGYPCLPLENFTNPHPSIVESILNTIAMLRPYWCCLQLLNDHDSTNMSDFVQSYLEKIKNNENNDENKSNTSPNNRRSPRNNSSEQDLMNMVKNVSLNDAKKRTCLCSDEFMMRHLNLISSGHPERPDRIKRILDTLKEKGLYDRCGKIDSRHAKESELEMCHDKEYINRLKLLKSKTLEELIELSKNPDSVYYHFDTFECATLATGCVLSVVDNVCSNKYTNGVAVCRPPGHHAYSDSCSGFCFFNSIAVAARYAQKNYPSIKKVLILDFDVHHGNGTQDIFKDDKSVLFISLHRYDNGCFYPVDADSNYDFVGDENAKGFNINIPWSQSTAGDAEYAAAFLRVVMPVAYQFNPDLVLISAGFDAAAGDPLGGYNITPSGFAQMTKMLCNLANGKVVMALEGGYNLTSISESMSSCVSVLLGDRCPSLPPVNAKEKAYGSIKNVINVLKPYWSCFQFDRVLPSSDYVKTFKGEKTKEQNKLIELPYRLRERKKNNENSPSPINSGKNSPRNTPKKSTRVDSPSVTSSKTKAKPSDKTKEETNKEEAKNTEAAATTVAESVGATNGNVPEMTLAILDPDLLTEEFQTAVAVVPLSFCPHLLEIDKNPTPSLIDSHKPCSECNDPKENWVCLSCYSCCCSRFVKGHMSKHNEKTNHPMVLSYSDLSVWCYVCDSYVSNELLDNAKRIAYDSKFNST